MRKDEGKMANKNSETKQEMFTKEQILVANKYMDRKDILNTILIDGQKYSIEKVDALLEKFMKGMVK